MDLHSITPVILTFDEEPNIARTLSALGWATDIVVLDSGSSDRTVEIAGTHPNVRVLSRAFDAHANQWNFALRESGIRTDWVLSLDADYVMTPELVDELRGLQTAPEVAGYQTSFVYCVAGRPLRGSVYPPVTTLFRRALGEYRQDGHTQRLDVKGRVDALRSPILHDDRKSVRHWLASQNRYMELEAAKLCDSPAGALTAPDRIRKLVFLAPFLVFFYALFVKGAILDGRAGLYYALQRSVAEMILSLHLMHRKLFA